MSVTIDARCNHGSCERRNHYVMEGRCTNCGLAGIVLIRNGHTASDARYTARCPRCECKTISIGKFIEGNGFVA